MELAVSSYPLPVPGTRGISRRRIFLFVYYYGINRAGLRRLPAQMLKIVRYLLHPDYGQISHHPEQLRTDLYTRPVAHTFVVVDPDSHLFLPLCRVAWVSKRLSYRISNGDRQNCQGEKAPHRIKDPWVYRSGPEEGRCNLRATISIGAKRRKRSASL